MTTSLIGGGGAAGLSAALVLTRARRRVAVVDAGQPRNAPAAHMQGFLGSDGVPPAELLAAGRAEVAGYGGHLVTGTVAAVTPCAWTAGRQRKRSTSRLEDGSALRTRRVLVTTGLRDERPGHPRRPRTVGARPAALPLLPRLRGPRPTPRRPRRHDPEAVAHAHLVRQWSDDVVFFANGTPCTPPSSASSSPPAPSASSTTRSPASSSRTTT